MLQAPAAEIAARQQEYGFFTETDPQVLENTVRAYQRLGCWQQQAEIPKDGYENLLDLFSISGGTSLRYPYDAAIVVPPS